MSLKYLVSYRYLERGASGEDFRHDSAVLTYATPLNTSGDRIEVANQLEREHPERIGVRVLTCDLLADPVVPIELAPRQPVVSEYLMSVLVMIRRELDRVMQARHQVEYASPFDNTGATFDCETFSVQAYSWDEELEQPWNFRWRDVEIHWYKHAGRGVRLNRELGSKEAAEMLDECLAAVRSHGLDNMTA